MKPYNIVLAAYLLSVLPVIAQPTLDFKQLPKEVGLKVREFNFDQPRHPPGVSEGVQFARAGKKSTPRAAKPSKPAAAPKPPAMSDGFKRNVAAAQAKLSPSVKSLLQRDGVQIKTGAVLTDIFPEARGQKLPGVGTPEGMTLDALDAVYKFDKKRKTIGISEFVKHDGQFIAMPPERTEAAVLHETGHALDQALGKDIGLAKFSDMKEFVDAYVEDHDYMSDGLYMELAYFMQGEGKVADRSRGRAETFAELFAWISGGVGTHYEDIRPYFPRLTKGMEGVVGTLADRPPGLTREQALAAGVPEHLVPSGAGGAPAPAPTGPGGPSAQPAPTGPPPPAGVPEGGQFGSGTGTTSKPSQYKPEEKPDDSKVAQQLIGGAIMKDTQMKWFFNMDRNEIVQLVARIEGNNFIGDAHREVKPGESFFGVSYASLRVAKFGTVDVDAKGHGTLHPAR